MKKTNNKGFSLVELIIVIAIMAVLVGILAPQFIQYVERSRESTDMQNIESFKVATEAMLADGTIALPTAASSITFAYAANATTVTPAGSLTAANVTAIQGIAGTVDLKSAAAQAGSSVINVTTNGVVTVTYATNLDGK